MLQVSIKGINQKRLQISYTGSFMCLQSLMETPQSTQRSVC